MKKEDKLHKLIHSMSMSEKRYFSVYAQRHTIGDRNNYIQLFEFVEQMPQYNNEELIKKLQTNDLSIKHLASDKNYLYQLILKSLSLYHSGKTSSLKIKEWLHQIEILYGKGLYNQCLQIIGKARKLAEQYDLHTLTQEITRWECKALGNSGQFKAMREKLNQAKDELKVLHNLYDFQELFYEMLALRTTIDIARNNESLDKLELFMQHQLLDRVEKAYSIQAKVYFWRIWAMYHYISDNDKGELGALSSLRDLLETEPEYKQEFSMDYVVTYCRILQLRNKESDDVFNQEVAHFSAFPNQVKRGKKKISAHVESFVALTKLSRLIELKRYEEAFAYVPESDAIFKQYDALIGASRKLSYRYILAYTYITHAQYKQALKYVNIILNEHKSNLRPEIHSFTRILNLIIHYELGNHRLIQYAAESASRYLKKKDRLFELESYLIKWFKKLSNAQSESKRKKLFETCLDNVNQILSKDLNAIVLQYFDIERWLESHIKGVKFIELKEVGQVEE